MVPSQSPGFTMKSTVDLFSRYIEAKRSTQAPGSRPYRIIDLSRDCGASPAQVYGWRSGSPQVPAGVVAQMVAVIGGPLAPWLCALGEQYSRTDADRAAWALALGESGELPPRDTVEAAVIGPGFTAAMLSEQIAQQAQADQQRAHDAGEALRQSKAEAKRPRPGEGLDELRERYAAIDGCSTLDELAALDAIPTETGDMRTGQGEG